MCTPCATSRSSAHLLGRERDRLGERVGGALDAGPDLLGNHQPGEALVDEVDDAPALEQEHAQR